MASIFAPSLARADQYACFWHSKAPPLKVTIEGTTVTLDHPAEVGLPARSEELHFLRLPEDKHSAEYSGDACTLIRNDYGLGEISKAYCWKGTTRELYIDTRHFNKSMEWKNGNAYGSTTLYNCVGLE